MDSSYRIDPVDRVVSVDAGWIAFAEANRAPGLPQRTIGRSIWMFVSNPTVRELYRSVFRRVRTSQQRVDVPFRCDSPEVRRFMTLAVCPADAQRGTLDCQVTLLREESQPAAARALYEAMGVGASEWHVVGALTVCSWCKRVEVDGWCEIDEALERRPALLTEPVQPITHGVCESCQRIVLVAPH